MAIRLGAGWSTGTDTSWYDNVTVSPSVGIRELHEAPAFRPDPATDRLWVDLDERPTAVTAVDANGRIHALDTWTHGEGTLVLPVARLVPGLYLLRIGTANNVRWLRFLKQ